MARDPLIVHVPTTIMLVDAQLQRDAKQRDKERNTTTRRVCRFLAKHGPSGCSDIGTVIDNRKGRVSASTGGGDYAAQMLLGRMKKAGLVRHVRSEGSSLWELTAKGQQEAHK